MRKQFISRVCGGIAPNRKRRQDEVTAILPSFFSYTHSDGCKSPHVAAGFELKFHYLIYSLDWA